MERIGMRAVLRADSMCTRCGERQSVPGKYGHRCSECINEIIAGGND